MKYSYYIGIGIAVSVLVGVLFWDDTPVAYTQTCTPFDSLVVDATGSLVASARPTSVNNTYTIVASGTYRWGPGGATENIADAECAEMSLKGSPGWSDPPGDDLELTIDGGTENWGACNTNTNTYTITKQGTGFEFAFGIIDNDGYADNSGSVSVVIDECITSVPPPSGPATCTGNGIAGLGGAGFPDINSDGCVDFVDLSILLSCWGSSTPGACFAARGSVGTGPAPPSTPPPAPTPSNSVPVVSWDNPLDTDTLIGLNGVRIEAIDSDGTVISATWCVGTGACTPSAPLTHDTLNDLWADNWDSATVSDGAYTLCATATDNEGGQGTSCIAVTVNNGSTGVPPSEVTATVGPGAYPNIAVDPVTGNVHVAYGMETGLQYVEYSPDLQTKITDEIIPGTCRVGSNPNGFCGTVSGIDGTGGIEIELDSSGNPHIAVWNNWDVSAGASDMQVFYVWHDGFGWSTLLPISTLGNAPTALQGMAIDGDDDVYIAFYRNEEAVAKVVTLKNGSIVSGPTNAIGPSESPNTQSAIASNNGIWWLVKKRDRASDGIPDPPFYLPHLAKFDGGSYGGSERIVTTLGTPTADNMQHHMGLAEGPGGDLHAVWTRGHEHGEIWYARRSGGTWGGDTMVVSGTDNMRANIGVTSTGKIYVTWGNLLDNKAYYTVFDSTWSVPTELHSGGSQYNDWMMDIAPIVTNGDSAYVTYWSDGTVHVKGFDVP